MKPAKQNRALSPKQIRAIRKKKGLKTRQDKTRISDVSKLLSALSELYGFKIPTDPQLSLVLTKFVCKSFGLTCKQIAEAFEMAATEKIDAGSVIPYGKIITIPVLAKVLKTYSKYINQQKPEKVVKQISSDEVEKLNIQARLLLLENLKDETYNFHSRHYYLIDVFIEKFDDQHKIDVYQDELTKAEDILKSKAGVTMSLSDARMAFADDTVPKMAKNMAKIRLVREYIFGSDIDFDLVKRNIENGIRV